MNRDTSSSSGSTTALSKLLQFTQEHTPPALTRATYPNVTIGVVQKTLSRGCRYRELALLDLIRQELPSDTYPALQPHLLTLFEALLARKQFDIAAPDASAGRAPPTECSGLDYRLGAIETSYLDVCTFLEAHLVEFWDAMRATAIELAPSMPILSPLLSVGSDPVYLLLTRMRAMAEAKLNLILNPMSVQIRRPAKMADLRPLINLGGALSKLSSVNRERAFRAIDRAADGCLTAFLEEVWVREVVADGWLPSPIPTLSDRLWLRLLRGDQSGATYDARMGKAMLAVAVGDAIGENLKEGVDVEDEKVFLATILSEQSLLTFMFRTGIYQDLPGCAFNGMDAAKAPHPARAFHLVLSAAYNEAPVLERTAVVASMVKTMWKTPMRVMCDGYVYFSLQKAYWDREHNTSYSTTEEPAQKRRRVASLVQSTLKGCIGFWELTPSTATDTANAEKILPQEKATHWALISTPENARAAVGGRTTIPKITTIGKRAAKTDRAPEPVPDALVKELAPAAPIAAIPRTPDRVPPMPITLATTERPSPFPSAPSLTRAKTPPRSFASPRSLPSPVPGSVPL
ncbi:hypothetical protein DFH06DRAFT_1131930 [Mycena polygramma]|nr:hypothetical protein DFH06DRAFT_1131930 [Mycena polygramma]